MGTNFSPQVIGMPNSRNTFGGRIASLLEKKGMTQSDLARRIGKSPQTVQKWVNGGGVRGKNLEEVAKVLGTTEAYLLAGDSATYYIEVYPYDVNHYELNAKGLELDIYQDIKLEKNLLSNSKTKMGLPYIMAALAAKEKGLDDLFLVDHKGSILETSSCNVFVISNGVLYTPSLDEGCLAGTMRMQIINLALANGIKVYECSLMPQNLLAADEVFLTNAIRGINWVGGYRTKRYQNNISRRLVVLLNAYWEQALSQQ